MEAQEIQQKVLHTMRGELALLVAVLINSFGVVLMLHSGAGISAISSMPFAFSEVFTRISLGTWTYLFQGVLVLSLMILRKRFVPQYLFSFVVGFVFGELLDVHEAWINLLPLTLPNRILYFAISYLLICIGIALSNRCGLPIIPTDLFPRELALHENASSALAIQPVAAIFSVTPFTKLTRMMSGATGVIRISPYMLAIST